MRKRLLVPARDPRPSIRRLRRLLRVRKEVLAVSRGRIRGFWGSPSSAGFDSAPSVRIFIPRTPPAFPRNWHRRVFVPMGYAGEAARLLLVFSRGGALIAPSRHPDEIPCVSFEIDPHLPAFPVRADSGDSGMMAEPVASLKNIEFPKNSIKLDKFTGFFDKFTGYFRELFSWEMTPRNRGAGEFCHDRAGPAMTANAGSCGGGNPPGALCTGARVL